MSYKISVKAADDIENIWLYTLQNWSFEQADKYVNLILNEIEYISKNPYLAKDFSSLRKNYRCTKIMSHIIFYRLIENKNDVEIIRVLHQIMDVDNRLKD